MSDKGNAQKVDRLVRIETAAEQLDMSVKALRGWVLAGKIEYCKFGPANGKGPIRFKQSVLDKIVEDARKPAQTSLDGRTTRKRVA